MKRSIIILSICSLFFLVSCNSKKNQLEEITNLEKELFDTTKKGIDESKAILLVDKYVAFADKFKDDSLAPMYLFKGAEICMNIRKGQRAIDLFARVIKDYPSYKNAPEALFLTAFTFENVMEKYQEAEKNYKLFIEKYPSHSLKQQAELSLQHLGKTPDELVAEFEEKLKNDSLQTTQK